MPSEATPGCVCAPAVDHRCHVGRHIRAEKHLLTRYGMDKPECAGMQGLSRTESETICHELVVGRAALAPQDDIPAIAGIVEQRVSDMTHVNTYLMCAPGLEDTTHHAYRAERLYHLIVRDGMLATVAIGENRHFESVARIAVDVANHSTDPWIGNTPEHSYIFAPGGLLEKLTSEAGLGIRSLCHNKQSGRVFVDTVHKSHAGIIDIVIGIVPEVPRERIDECAVIVAMPGVHHKSRRLIHDKHHIILIDYVEGYVFGEHFKLISRPVHDHLHHIERFHTIVGLDSLAIDKHTPGLSCLLNTVARRMLKPFDKKFVDTKQLLPRVGHESEMFVKAAAVRP